jgi:hypothetical protein
MTAERKGAAFPTRQVRRGCTHPSILLRPTRVGIIETWWATLRTGDQARPPVAVVINIVNHRPRLDGDA